MFIFVPQKEGRLVEDRRHVISTRLGVRRGIMTAQLADLLVRRSTLAAPKRPGVVMH